MDIKTQARPVLTAVGTRETFDERVASFGMYQAQAEIALAGMVAFAYSAWHKGGADQSFGIDAIREEISLPKDQARRLGNCLGRISKTPPEEGVSVAKSALAFANTFVADFYSHETKARLAAAAKRKAAQVEKAKDAKKNADAALKVLTDEAKAEGKAEAEVEVIEFTLVGKEGFTTALTEEEYTFLAITLDDIRNGRAVQLTAVA